MPAAYAADVPLICDPVPGPLPVPVTMRALDVMLPLAVHHQINCHMAQIRNARPGGRSEWPDAEFCAT